MIKPKSTKEYSLKDKLKELWFNPSTDKYKETDWVYTVYRILWTFTL
jgi:hypothetical protein